jgi:putative endonuclease
VFSEKINLGKLGEDEALDFLVKNGYKIIARNYRTKLGEVDIIASDRDTFCFVEVKARRTCIRGTPAEAVSGVKQNQISKAALQFIKDKGLWGKKARFDVVSVIYSGGKVQSDLIKNAFELNERFSI